MAATIKLTNQEFLEALAGDDWERVPISWGAESWVARPAGKHLAKRGPLDANYYTVSIFALAADGRFRRTKDLFRRQFAFVIDDVGTKINEAALRATLPSATYELETSPGNRHLGFKLTGATDARALEALVDAIISDPEINPSGKDPGMKGVTRIVRLPVGANLKPEVMEKNGGKPWPHRLWVWEPSRAYTIEQLAFWLGVDLSEGALARFKDISGTRCATGAELEADPILKIFDQKEMLLDATPNQNGFVAVLCPWRHEHSDARTDGTGYKPGSGGFQCHHGHCESRNMDDLRRWIAEECAPERTVALAETFGDVAEDDSLLLAEVARAKARLKDRVEKQRIEVEEVLSEWAFIVDLHRYGRVSTNEILKEQTFNALNAEIAPYGASGQKSAAAVFINDLGGPHCKTATYEPGRPAIYVDPDDGRNVFNTWRPGPVPEWPFDEVTDRDISPWLDHVAFVLPDPVAREQFVKWCAFLVQRPGVKINWAYLLIGGQGIGKDLLLRPIYGILGKANYTAISAEDFERGWTDWAESQLVVVEELPSFHKRDVYDWLKRYVASGVPYFRVNKKNLAIYSVRNLQNWFIFSNHDDALALEADDRRYFVYESPAKKRDPSYYFPLADEEAGIFNDATFQSKLADWLKRYDISAFNPGEAPPMTEAKTRMLEATRHPIDCWLDDQFDEGGRFYGRKLFQAQEAVAAVQAAGKVNLGAPDLAKINVNRVGRWLRNAGWFQMGRVRGPSIGAMRLWAAPKESAEIYTQMSGRLIEEKYLKDVGGADAGGLAEGEPF